MTLPVEIPPFIPPRPAGTVPARVLDIGAADGRNAGLMADAGYDAVALEIDVDLARLAAKRMKGNGGTVVVGDGLRIPFIDGSFDGALLIEVAEHLHDTETLLREIHRVLRPGGTLVVGIPTAYTEHIYWRLHPQYAENATHVKIITRRQMLTHLRACGFTVTTVEPRNLLPAISWLFHSILRSRSDHTGRILEHQSVDVRLERVWSAVARRRGGVRLLTWAGRRIGKSRYFYCLRQA